MYEQLALDSGFIGIALLLATAPVFASTTSCPNLYRNLSFGSRGQDVVELQNFLIDQGDLAPGLTTGYFGYLTKTSVAVFQTQSGLPSIGLVGPLTRAKISQVCSAIKTGMHCEATCAICREVPDDYAGVKPICNSEVTGCYTTGYTRCERQADGECNWTDTAAFGKCLLGPQPPHPKTWIIGSPGPSRLVVGQEGLWTIQTHSIESRDTNIQYVLDFGDGSPPVVQFTPLTVAHTYAKPGRYPFSFALGDNVGNALTYDSITVVSPEDAGLCDTQYAEAMAAAHGKSCTIGGWGMNCHADSKNPYYSNEAFNDCMLHELENKGWTMPKAL